MTSTRFSSGSAGAGSQAGGGSQAGAAADVLAGSSLTKGKHKKSRRGFQAAPKASGQTPARKAGKRGACGARALLLHDFAVVLRQLMSFALVALAAFLVAMPVSTAAIPDASIFNLDYVHDQMKFRFWLDDLTYEVVLGTAVYGVVLGVRAFRFLLVKCESTSVLSLPLTRASVFGTRFAACVVALVVGVGVPCAVSLVVNVAALGVWEGLFSQFAYVLAGLLITGGVACAVAVVACAVAGTVAEAVAFATALLCSVSVACWGLNAVMDHLLVGSAFGAHLYNSTASVAPSLLEQTAAFNPLLFFMQEAADHQVFLVQHPLYAPVAGNAVLLCGWLVALVALAALACVLVCRRKGERAGIAGLCVVVALVVGLVVGLAVFGGAFTLLADLNVVAAVAGAFAVFWVVSAVLFSGPLKPQHAGRRVLATLGAETAALGVVLAVVATGALGYAQAVPDASDVESVSVSYPGTPSYLAVGFDSAKAGDGSYYFSAEYTFSDEQAISAVRAVHQGLVETGGAALAQDAIDFSNTVMPYDVVIRYQLKDGRQLVRYYDRATLGQLAALAQLDDTSHARELARAVVSGDVSLLSDDDATAMASSTARQAYTLGDIYISDRLYASPMLVNCDAQARLELLSALAEDVAAQDAHDRYYPADACRGVLMFTQMGDAAAETFAYGVENTVVYLTDEFTHTLAWFEEKGLSGYLALDDEPAAVESITVQHYLPYDGMNALSEPQSAYFMGYRASVDQQFISMQDFGTKFNTTDADQIAELLPLARNTLFLDGGGYLLSCKLKGADAYSYLVISEADAPEWLVRVAG